MRRKARIAFALYFLMLVGVMGMCGYHLITFHREAEAEKKKTEQLRQIAFAPNERAALPEGEEINVAALREVNPNIIGWIRIPGTELDYPLVQASAAESTYYLNHDLRGNEDDHGVPFLDSRCDMNSKSLIVYGHHKADGTMFSCLWHYKEKEHLKEHPVIELFTQDGKEEYEIFSVMKAQGVAFREHWSVFNLPETEFEFEEMIGKCKEQSLYDVEAVPKCTSRLLTLITCDYSQNNGRLAVAAYRKEVR